MVGRAWATTNRVRPSASINSKAKQSKTVANSRQNACCLWVSEDDCIADRAHKNPHATSYAKPGTQVKAKAESQFIFAMLSIT